MARSYAAIHVSIWVNEDFKRLSRDTQWLYLYLISQGKLDAAGIISWRPRVAMQVAADVTLQDVEAGLQELRARRFVVLDEDTEELLVRSFMRNDGKIRNSKQAVAIKVAWESTDSAMLRGVVSHELARLAEEDPAMPGIPVCKNVLSGPFVDPWTIPLN